MDGEASITTPYISENSFALKPTYIHSSKIAINCEETCLKQGKVSFTHNNVVNDFIVYELDIWSHDLSTGLLKDYFWSCSVD